MTEHDLIFRNEHWLSAWVGSEMMMMHGESGSCLSLSETAGRIWDILAEPSSTAALAATLQREYRVPPDDMLAAIQAFVQQMIEEGMAHVEPMLVH